MINSGAPIAGMADILLSAAVVMNEHSAMHA